MFSSSEQPHFQSAVAVPRLHTLGDTEGWRMDRRQHMQCGAHPSTREAGSVQGKKRMWANTATQALMHLDLCTTPLLFIPLRYCPAPVAQRSAEMVEQTLERAAPQRDGSRSWKTPTSLALWVFFPHPAAIFFFGSSCDYHFRAQDWICGPKFPPWMPSSAQC